MNDYENEMNYEDRILETTYTAEDSETEFSLRPRTLDEYIGQEKAKEILKIYIDAVKMRGDTLDHVLLYGPPGLGKTTLSAIIAAELGVNFRVTSGPAIEKQGDLAALLTNLGQGDVLFFIPLWKTLLWISSSAKDQPPEVSGCRSNASP